MDNKTAVQWLEKELQSKLIKIVLENDYALIDSLFQQATQKERQQIEEAYMDSTLQFDNASPIINPKTPSEYYNQTYTQNKTKN